MFLFTCDFAVELRGRAKGRNLRANPKMVVHLESSDECVIREGVAEQVGDPDPRRRIGEVYAAKYGIDATRRVRVDGEQLSLGHAHAARGPEAEEGLPD